MTSVSRRADEAKASAAEAFVFPASFAQRRLWFLDQLEPWSAFYNISTATRLPGPLDIDALRASIDALVRRHETLRTSFRAVEGEPAQIIAPSLTLDLPVQDLRGLPENVREAEALGLATSEAQQPFDLERGPLIRTRLLKLADTEHVLVLTLHHIIADGWSMNILCRDLNIIYDAIRSGREPNLPDLQIQYADYAVWQQEWLSGDTHKTLLSYWKQQLAGAPSVLELPANRARPPVQLFRGGAHAFVLPAALADALRVLSEGGQVTLFMALLAGFNMLLFRYTGQEDLLVGAPIANRTRPELEGLIGFFANTLVLRTKLSGDFSFRELIERVRDMPFERLVEELGPERNLAYNPLFQVMFVFQSVSQAPRNGRARQPDPLPPVVTGVAKFDLTLFLTETEQEIQGTFEYNSDLFDPEMIARMAGHLQNLLSAAVADPGRPLWALAMLSEADLLALEEWNATQRPCRPRCVHQLVEQQAARIPDGVAIRSAAGWLTYRELNARANFWAHCLLEQGIGPDSRVGLYAARSAEAIVGMLAVLKAGGAYVPLDPSYPAERLAFMLEDSGAALLLTQARLLGQGLAADQPRVLVLDQEEHGMREDNPSCVATPDNLAYVIYTSGSTGRPKGVAMPHRALHNLLEWQIARSALPAGAETLHFAPIGFDVSFQEIFSTLSAGGMLVLPDEQERRDPDAVWCLLEKQHVKRIYLPYASLQQLAERARELDRLPNSLREVITAGEQLQITPPIVEMFERMGCTLYNQYGPSETHVVTEFKLSGSPHQWPALPSIGRPVPNVTIGILDAHGQPVPIDVPGELYIGGVALARGYIGKAHATAERFVPDPDSAPGLGGRVYRTGDRARYLRDGNIDFLGRLDDQLKVRGFRVEPGEVEAALRRHAGVREVAVIGARNSSGEASLVAYLQLSDQAAASVQDLRTHLGASLPVHMIPATFVFLDSLPLTPSGKVDRRRLPDPKNVRAATATFVAPRTPIEGTLAQIWVELLSLERVGVHDNFFDLGGHSLLATRVISRIRHDLDVELPLRSIFETPTVEGLALLVVDASIRPADEHEVADLLTDLERLGNGEAQGKPLQRISPATLPVARD
jgi:amino acid adenylation domain-containing protein